MCLRHPPLCFAVVYATGRGTEERMQGKKKNPHDVASLMRRVATAPAPCLRMSGSRRKARVRGRGRDRDTATGGESAEAAVVSAGPSSEAGVEDGNDTAMMRKKTLPLEALARRRQFYCPRGLLGCLEICPLCGRGHCQKFFKVSQERYND